MNAATIGGLRVEAILDGHGKEPAQEILTRHMHAGDPWTCHAHELDADGNLPLSVGGFLVKSGSRTILVDAGVGGIDNGKYRGGLFLENLRRHGVEPEEVTDVVFTHLHFDHVGWATRKGEIVFPNATYRVHQADWDYFVESSEAEAGAVRKLAPIRDRLETFDTNTTIAPGFDARPMTGHTPGSTVYVLSDAGETGVFLGDLAHTPFELTEPGWEFANDLDKAASLVSRAEFVEEFADTRATLFGAHFPGLRPGQLSTMSGALRWKTL
jgi:glyoxylase-like metal-dependent hydrolase (beta-lactamase superfamily II)